MHPYVNSIAMASIKNKHYLSGQIKEACLIFCIFSFMQIVTTGVCHSDLYHLFESMHKDGFPVVLGHEGAGIVESVGSGVTEFQPGQLKHAFSIFICPLTQVPLPARLRSSNTWIKALSVLQTMNHKPQKEDGFFALGLSCLEGNGFFE